MQKSKRLTVTLNHRTYAVIAELAALQGRPKAKIISELLEATTPVMERTAHLLGLAQKASSGMAQDFKGSLERSEELLGDLLDTSTNRFEEVASELESEGYDQGDLWGS